MPDRPKHYQWHEHDVEDQDSTRPFEPSGIELNTCDSQLPTLPPWTGRSWPAALAMVTPHSLPGPEPMITAGRISGPAFRALRTVQSAT